MSSGNAAGNAGRSVLVIEGDHDTIVAIRRFVNSGGFLTRNMVWRQGILSRWSGGKTYEDFAATLQRVNDTARADARAFAETVKEP